MVRGELSFYTFYSHSSVINTMLSDLPYSRRAAFDSRKICLTSTRTAILDEIMSRISIRQDPGSKEYKRVLLLHGMAGTGKSTIANTIAFRYDQLTRLGASFCFKRGDTERIAQNMFSTIARGLADLEEAYRLKLYDLIKSNTRLRTSGTHSHHFISDLLSECII
jgi:hypothetical protein